MSDSLYTEGRIQVAGVREQGTEESISTYEEGRGWRLSKAIYSGALSPNISSRKGILSAKTYNIFMYIRSEIML
jgi:hypothetical protein